MILNSGSEHHLQYSVIIVGAGISGLTAARDLIEQYPDLLIVEASCCTGGRVKEVQDHTKAV